MSTPPALSFVLPVHNEAEALPILWREIDTALRALGQSAEIIIVDDGSTDRSLAVARALAAQDPRIRLCRLRENSGLTAAFCAGFSLVRGDIVVTMDTDLQNDPADLPRLLEALVDCDAVIGWRQRRDDSFVKRVSSMIGNGVRNRLTGDRVHDSASSFRVMRRACLASVPPYAGMHRFVPTLLRMAGHRVREVPIHHRPRLFGESKFGIRNRAWRGLQDVLAVRWMMRRRLRYTIEPDDSAGTETDARSGDADRTTVRAPSPPPPR